MLVLTKKYELIEVNLFKFAFLLSVIVIVIAAGASLITNIPDNINLAISIPLSLIATFIWEFSVKKKNKIFDEEGIEMLLTRLNEADANYFHNFTNSFITTKNKSRAVLKLNKSGIIEELLLLNHFIQSSFFDRRRQLVKPGNVNELHSVILSRGSLLEKDFKVDFNNLAFLYEMNIHYLYHNYGIAGPIQLNYSLTNKHLKIQKSFTDYPLYNKITALRNKEFEDHPYKVKYAGLFNELFFKTDYVEERIEQPDQFYIDLFVSFYSFYEEIHGDPDFVPLTLHTDYDLLSLLNILEARNVSIHKVTPNQGLSFDQLRIKIEERLKSHPVLNFFFTSVEDFKFFKDNFDDFQFSDLYQSQLLTIYESELSRNLINGKLTEFTDTFAEYQLLEKIHDDERVWEKFFKKFYDNITFGVELRFDDIVINISTGDINFNKLMEEYLEYHRALLMQASKAATIEEFHSIISRVFDSKYTIPFFQSIPIYLFYPFEKFSQYWERKD